MGNIECMACDIKDISIHGKSLIAEQSWHLRFLNGHQINQCNQYCFSFLIE